MWHRFSWGRGGGGISILTVTGDVPSEQGMIFTVIHIGTARIYLNRPNWLLAGCSVYNRVASPGFPADNVYDRLSISAPATVRAGPQCL